MIDFIINLMQVSGTISDTRFRWIPWILESECKRIGRIDISRNLI